MSGLNLRNVTTTGKQQCQTKTTRKEGYVRTK